MRKNNSEVDDTRGLSKLKLSTETPSTPPKQTHANPLYECWNCSRLVETQNHRDKAVVPRFCPWCGKPVSSLIGREIDGYRIDEVISRGGFGIIYLASNIAQPAMKAAVKFLRPEMVYRRPELIKIFIEEARLTEAIGQTCWNIVRLSNVREKPWPYFFMEYIRGSTMESFIESHSAKRIPLRECLGYLRAIAKGLAVTHSHGRIHRDLKPLNIMVIRSHDLPQPEEKIKLLDFGLAMKIAGRRDGGHSEISASGLTTSGSVDDSPLQSAGTPEYMPPEAFDGINEFGGDLYSFGVTAYEILTGERPWKDPSLETQRFSYWRDCHKKKPPRPIRELRPEVPKWLARVVAECLEKDPKRRLTDAGVLLKRLREPTPRWVKLSAAAAVLVFGAVSYYAATAGRGFNETVTWTVDEIPIAQKPAVLYVSGEGALARSKVKARVSSGSGEARKILKWSTTPAEVVACTQVEDALLLLEFLKTSPSLAGKSVIVRGRGAGFVFEDALKIEFDRERPAVGDLKHRDPSNALRPVREGQRFASETEFSVEVNEPHLNLDLLRLQLEGPGENRREWKLVPGENTGLFSCRLESVPDGKYTASVVATDMAKNQNEPKKIGILVDNTLNFALARQNPWIARKTVVYEFKIEPGGLREELAEVLVTGEGGKDPLPYEIFVNTTGDTLTAIGLIDLMKKENLVPVSGLEPDRDRTYLLAIPLAEGQKDYSFEVKVFDRSIPRNERPFLLRGPCPEPLARTDLLAIDLDHIEGQGRRSTPWSGKSAAQRLPGSLKRVAVTTSRKNTVLHGECSVDGRTFPLRIEPEQVSLDVPELPENRDTRLVLTLHDQLEKTLTFDLSVHLDTQPPVVTELTSESTGPAGQKIKINHLSPDAQCHYVTGRDIRLRVRANEALLGVNLVIAGKDWRKVPGKYVSESKDVWEFESLETLHLEEENPYDLDVQITDLVGQGISKRIQLNINRGPPNVDISPSVKDKIVVKEGIYQLINRDVFLVDAFDGNGIDDRHAEFKIKFSGSEKPVTPTQSGNAYNKQYSINLMQLPNGCNGSILADVPDRFGKTEPQEWRFYFEFEKEYREEVPWKGLVWINFKGLNFYISKTEISNKLFRARNFSYRPKYWGKNYEFPSYVMIDGERKQTVPGDNFPVVGVPPDVIWAYARAVFGEGVRLPKLEEWKKAAWVDNQGDYPWGKDERGMGWFNYRGCRLRKNPVSIFSKHHCRGRIPPGQDESIGDSGPVEVNFPPFPEDFEEHKFCKVWHMLGNVGELVLDEEQNRYAVAGGSFQTPEGRTGVFRSLIQYVEPSDDTGFRLVIDLNENVPQDFLERALIPRGGQRK